MFEIGGTADVSLSALMSAMVGWHLLIGIGEAIITALTVSAVLAVRPDLVYGARGSARRSDRWRSGRPTAQEVAS